MDIQFIENSEYLDIIKELGFSAEQCYMPLARYKKKISLTRFGMI